MMLDIKELPRLSEKLNEVKSKKSKAEGALDQIYSDMAKQFQCSTFELAQEKIKTIDDQNAIDERELDKLLLEIEKSVDWKAI